MLKLYDTYKKRKVEFKPVKEGKVGMYNCGPTVYDFVTIGNLRAYVFEDILRRTLEYLGYDVTQVMNITDVGHLTMSDMQKELVKKKGIKLEITDTDDGLDRMEKAAKREGITVWDVAQKYIDATFGKNYKDVSEFEQDGDFGKMNILKPHYLPRATEYVEEQVEFIKELEKKGFTYKTKQAVYFDISKFPKYEELIGQSFEDMKKGERANTTDKDRKHPADFRLWQLDQPDHQMQWDSPWGKGFPGWHIECSAMSRKLLGQPFDIHTGGEDHIKVHHPSEMAQSESAYGKPMANYWLHNAFITVDGQRMGKSLGNAYTLTDVIEKGFDPMDLRYFYLQAHYRTKQNFSWKNLEKAREARLKLVKIVKQLSGANEAREITAENKWKESFIKAMEDDLNTPQALAVLWEMLSANEDDMYSIILDFDKVLGLGLSDIKEVKISDKKREEIEKLVKEREDARKAKDYEKADKIRNLLEEKYDIQIEDTDSGTVWNM